MAWTRPAWVEIAALLAEADQPFALEVERRRYMIERRLNQTSFTVYLTGAEQALPRRCGSTGSGLMDGASRRAACCWPMSAAASSAVWWRR